MKQLFLLFIGLLLSCQMAFAQQDPLFAQYNSNAFLINPAVAGSKGNHSFNLFHRWQWVSFPGAPQTFGLTYQGLIKDLHGVGAVLFGDITGPSARWGGKVSYAFHIPLADRKMRLSIGLAGRIVHNTIRTDQIQFINPTDQAVVNADQGVTSADAEFGLYFYTKRLRIGFSAPNLLQTRIDYGGMTQGRSLVGFGYRHYFLTGSYRIPVAKEKMVLEPSIMVKYVQGTTPQVDGGLTLHLLKEQVAFGLFYRSPAFLSFQARFLFDNKVPVLIGFDIALNSFQQHSVGSTEIMLGYETPGANLFGEYIEPDQNEPVPTGDL
ncbi:MAG: PorP/SprF family type IX secretion system membrane protein [Aureispira sp.]